MLSFWIFECFSFLCFDKLPLAAVAYPQMSHLYGFSPVWMFLCSFNWPLNLGCPACQEQADYGKPWKFGGHPSFCGKLYHILHSNRGDNLCDTEHEFLDFFASEWSKDIRDIWRFGFCLHELADSADSILAFGTFPTISYQTLSIQWLKQGNYSWAMTGMLRNVAWVL